VIRSRSAVLLAGVGLLSLAQSVLAGVLPAPKPSPNWLAAETVPVALASGFTPIVPTVALLPDGGVVAFTATAAGVVDLGKRSPATGKWAPVAGVVPAAPSQYITVVAHEVAGAGEVLAVWLDGAGVVQAATRSVAGTWSAQEALSGAGVGVPAVAATPDGGAVVVWRQGTTLRARTRATPVAPWTAEATVTTAAATLGAPAAAISLTGLIDVIWSDGQIPKFSRGAVAGNVWTAPADLPGHVPPLGVGPMLIHVDGLGSAIAIWLEGGCQWRQAVHDGAGSQVWIAASEPAPPACGDAGYFRSVFDLNRHSVGLFMGMVDEGPGPDSLVVTRRPDNDPFAVLPGIRLYQAGGDARFNGAPGAAVTPNGSGYLSLTEGTSNELYGSSQVLMTNVSPTGAVRNGYIVGSRFRRNVLLGFERLTGPTVVPTVADPLNLVNNAMVEWRSADAFSTFNRLRIAIRPGAGLRVVKLGRLKSGGHTAARVTLNQPAKVTVTFTTSSGRRIGRVVRSIAAGATVVRLPGSRVRPLGSYRVRVEAVNGGARATRKG